MNRGPPRPSYILPTEPESSTDEMIPSPPSAHAPVLRISGRGGLRLRLLLPVLLVALLAACGGGNVAGDGAGLTPSAESQMEFGVRMAQQGLWSEALFRFQQAIRVSPRNPRVLNNLAVAYEATGQFDQALDAYQRALQVDPQNRQLRRNYARFVEFYQSFRPQPEGDGGEGTASSDVDAGDPGRGGIPGAPGE